MTNSSKPLEGEILRPAVAAVPHADAWSALNNVVQATREYLKLREEQRTKRAEIDAYKTLESQRIRAAETVLKDYFEQVFAERSRNFTELLARLDQAAEVGDDKRVAETLGAIVAIAQKSPLADLGDLSKLRAALDDPDHVWEL